MILVDNSKQCSAILRFIAQPALESCPEPVRQVFDASRFSEFHTFLDGVMNVWVGLGDEETLTLTHVKSAAAIGAKMMRQLKQHEYQIEASGIIDLYGIDSVYDLCTGIELGLYQYEGCYSNAKEKYSYTAFLQGFEDQHQPEIQELVNKSVVVAQNVMMARNWVNMPGNLLNPVALAEHVVEAGKEAGCEVKVVDVEQAKKLGMNLFLSVGLSSDYPCSIVVLRYMGDPDDGEVTALVGKGVTLDTGGYNLKTKQGLLNTKGGRCRCHRGHLRFSQKQGKNQRCRRRSHCGKSPLQHFFRPGRRLHCHERQDCRDPQRRCGGTFNFGRCHHLRCPSRKSGPHRRCCYLDRSNRQLLRQNSCRCHD